MSKIGTIALELQEQANEMGFATVDECITAGYTPDLMTGTWATPASDFHELYEKKAGGIYEKMNKEFQAVKDENANPKDGDYYKLAMLYEIKEMVANMDESDRDVLDKLETYDQPLRQAYEAWLRCDEDPSLCEQLREAMRWNM